MRSNVSFDNFDDEMFCIFICLIVCISVYVCLLMYVYVCVCVYFTCVFHFCVESEFHVCVFVYQCLCMCLCVWVSVSFVRKSFPSCTFHFIESNQFPTDIPSLHHFHVHKSKLIRNKITTKKPKEQESYALHLKSIHIVFGSTIIYHFHRERLMYKFACNSAHLFVHSLVVGLFMYGKDFNIFITLYVFCDRKFKLAKE